MARSEFLYILFIYIYIYIYMIFLIYHMYKQIGDEKDQVNLRKSLLLA